MKKVIYVMLGLLAATVTVLYMSGTATAQKPPMVNAGGIKAADFKLTDLDGKTVKLSDYKGKVVILDFWATWCPPCVKEIPHFNQLSKTYGAKGLVVLGVSVDEGGAPAVMKFKKKNTVDYRIAISDDATHQTYQNYLPKEERGGIPFTFVIDKQGQIRQHYVGYRPMEVFEGVIKELL